MSFYRLIQQAIHQTLTPIFDPLFSEQSCGFRLGRSGHRAIDKAQYYIDREGSTVVDIDLEKFFDRVNHDILMSKVRRQLKDWRVIRLIRRYLQAGIMINGICITATEGTSQGWAVEPSPCKHYARRPR